MNNIKTIDKICVLVCFHAVKMSGNFQEESKRAKVKVSFVSERSNAQGATGYLLSAAFVFGNGTETSLETEINFTLCVCECCVCV